MRRDDRQASGSLERSPATSGISFRTEKSSSQVEETSVSDTTTSKGSLSGLRWWSTSTFGALDALSRASVPGLVLEKELQSRQKTRSLPEIVPFLSMLFIDGMQESLMDTIIRPLCLVLEIH